MLTACHDLARSVDNPMFGSKLKSSVGKNSAVRLLSASHQHACICCVSVPVPRVRISSTLPFCCGAALPASPTSPCCLHGKSERTGGSVRQRVPDLLPRIPGSTARS